jgi:hypothetical protein
MQFIIYSTEQTPDAPPPSPEMMAQLGQLTADSFKAGVLVTTGGVAAQGTRVRQSAGKTTVTDGPFIEAKELMGGFAVIDVKSVEEAVEWAKRFRSIVGDGESEIVRIYGPSDYAGGQ